MNSDHFNSSTRILRQLYFLRNITITFIVVMMTVALVGLKINLPVIPLSIIILIMAVTNLITRLIIDSGKEISEKLIFFQLLLEILSFSFILFFSGGATNPFTFFYLIPLAISATVIPGLSTWILTSITVILYSLLLKFYSPLTYEVHDHQAMLHDGQFSQHVLGMWFGFMVSAMLVTWFITYLSKELKHREKAITDARQRELRDQQMVTLGTLAAGTAHELGTPLASLAIITGELTDGFSKEEHPDLFENQAILHGQIQRCKKILSVLSDTTGESRADAGYLMPVKTFYELVIQHWLEQRPDIQFDTKSESLETPLQLLYDKTISQAIINLLNNAADASSESLEIHTKIEDKALLIEIKDTGKGLTEQQIAMAGEVSFSNKPDGMGIGLFLAITTIRRSGGSIEFKSRQSVGTCTLVRLALI